MRANTFNPCAWISVSNRPIVSLGPKRLGMVVRPSVLLGESDAGINQPGEKITIDHEAPPFGIVIQRGFRCDDLVAGFALFFQSSNLFANSYQHVAEFNQLRFVA